MAPTLQKRLLDSLREHRFCRAGDRIGIACSGGADSVALLRLMLDLRAELGIVLSVIHVNHKLRLHESDTDAKFVATLAASHGLELHSAEIDVAEFAERNGRGLEVAGREVRYQFFASLVANNKVARCATAHTADDQAETVLLRLLRGAGTRGFAGIHRTRDGMKIVRPLLDFRREELRTYLKVIGQTWREDATNTDLTFARNRVRAELLPLLEAKFNPAIVRALAATAEVAQAEEQYWHVEIERLAQEALSPHGRMKVSFLKSQPVALQRRLLRAMAGAPKNFEHIEQARELALKTAKSKSASVALENGATARVANGELWFEAAQRRHATNPAG